VHPTIKTRDGKKLKVKALIDSGCTNTTIARKTVKEKGISVTNFIRPYLHQFFIYSHGLNGYKKPLKRPFYRYQSCLEAISIGRDIRQINW